MNLESHLRTHVDVLARRIGGRSAGAAYDNLSKAAEYIESQLRAAGYSPARQSFEIHRQTFHNIEASLDGTAKADEIVVVGAHYDTAGGLPGANDNGSGVAATLELARLNARARQPRTIRWLFFVNEEPPFFQTAQMGSYVYARRCRERKERITAMLSLETIGFYSSAPGSQQYPTGFHPGYPDRGDFLGFVADFRSAMLLRRVLKTFRSATSLPAEGAAAPSLIPGIAWSDHWSFWQFGYRALMATDTAPFRYPYYHTGQDTPEKLEYESMTRAVIGLNAVVLDLASR